MSRRIRMILMIVGSIVLVLVAWQLFERAREPHYAGQAVSQWFIQYCRSSEADLPDWYQFERANRAFQRMGTNAVPFLLEQAFATKKESALTTNFYRMLGVFPKSWHLPRYIPPERLQVRAVEILWNLRAPAASLLPDLRDPLNSTNEARHLQAISLLSSSSDGAELAVPYVLRDLQSTNQKTRLAALGAVENLGAAGSSVVPVLTNMLNSTGSIGSGPVLRAIGAVGTNAVQALPELRREFQTTTNVELRCQLAGAIGRVAPDDGEIADFLWNEWHAQTNLFLRAQVLRALGRMGTKVPHVMEAMLEALDDPDLGHFYEGLDLIERNRISKEVCVPRLEMQLSNTNDLRRLIAAGAILVQEPDHKAALGVVTYYAKSASEFQTGAINLLCDRRPNAKETVELLNQVSKDAGSGVQEAIRDALKRMEIKKRLEREMP